MGGSAWQALEVSQANGMAATSYRFRSGWAGHVAYVEHVNPDGSFVVSEMNYYGNGGGWGRIDRRTIAGNDGSVMGFIY